MINTLDRRKAIKLIDECANAGASKKKACEVFKISLRTYKRWKDNGVVKDDNRPNAKRPEPANKLTPKEQQLVLVTCNEEDYQSLPPSQIVPALADKGIYIASESSFYRILRKFEESTKILIFAIFQFFEL